MPWSTCACTERKSSFCCFTTVFSLTIFSVIFLSVSFSSDPQTYAETFSVCLLICLCPPVSPRWPSTLLLLCIAKTQQGQFNTWEAAFLWQQLMPPKKLYFWRVDHRWCWCRNPLRHSWLDKHPFNSSNLPGNTWLDWMEFIEFLPLFSYSIGWGVTVFSHFFVKSSPRLDGCH